MLAKRPYKWKGLSDYVDAVVAYACARLSKALTRWYSHTLFREVTVHEFKWVITKYTGSLTTNSVQPWQVTLGNADSKTIVILM